MVVAIAVATIAVLVMAVLAWWPTEPARQPVPDDHDTSSTSIERPSTSRWSDERASSAKPQW